MARLLWLVDELRAAGLAVAEVDGWRTRGAEPWTPQGAILHATADKARTGDGDRLDDAGAVAVIRDGRADLPGPIATAYVNRQGVWWVIASGRCNTVKVGWAGPLKGWGNSRIIGVEAENDNRGEPWPVDQLRALHIGSAAIMRRLAIPVSRLAGHFEHQPGDKTDPHGIDMNRFRRDVAGALNPPVIEEDSLKLIIAREEGQDEVCVGNGVVRRHIADPAALADLQWWLRHRRGYSAEEVKVNVFRAGTLAGVLGVLVDEPAK